MNTPISIDLYPFDVGAAWVAQVVRGLDGGGIAEPLLFWAQVVAAVLSVLLVIGIIWVVRRSHLADTVASTISDTLQAPVPHDRVAERWEGVMQALQSSRSNDWKLAVIDADRLLEFALRHLPIGGETLADKLKEFDRSELSVIDDVWRAHKLRNTLVHGETEEINQDQARRAVEAIGAALRELGILA